jgi:hypothetical protein
LGASGLPAGVQSHSARFFGQLAQKLCRTLQPAGPGKENTGELPTCYCVEWHHELGKLNSGKASLKLL